MVFSELKNNYPYQNDQDYAKLACETIKIFQMAETDWLERNLTKQNFTLQKHGS